MYSREQVKAFTDKIFNMSGATDIEVNFTSAERSGTRFANSSISANLVQFDQQLTITAHVGSKSGSSNTRDFSDASLKATFDEALEAAKAAPDRTPPTLLGAQSYIPVDSALPGAKNFGPAERAKMVRTSIDISKKLGTVGSGFIPKTHQTTCDANTKGLFAFEEVAEASFVLTCRMPDGSGSGWAGTTGIKDISMINPVEITEVASNKALKSRNARALEPGRYTVILEPRANARFLSLMTGIFGGGGGAFMRDKKPGDKIFSEMFTLKSDIGNPILRQSSILGDNTPAAPVTWLEKGVLRNLSGGPNGTSPKANVNMSLHMEGTDLSIADMVKQTKRGLLVTFFWYIRGVPADGQPLLNTGMTRDGLFLIENGEITRPVQNFRWNMSPIVGYNNITLVGKSVPMHMGESYDGGGTALVPPVRIEDFYMTSISPAV
jgi:predicted Zn-dependent protease